jgi:hypothetical protein
MGYIHEELPQGHPLLLFILTVSRDKKRQGKENKNKNQMRTHQ